MEGVDVGGKGVGAAGGGIKKGGGNLNAQYKSEQKEQNKID